MDRKISKTEAELLSSAIERIITSEVIEKDISGKLPLTDEMHDSNKVYHGKASMLFVDMRESTKLPEKFSADQLVKIYRSYIRTVVQAIRYSGGYVRDFMGDGVLAVFVDDEDGNSEDKAVFAARYITTVIDKFLNPVLNDHLHHRISCGIGVHTGDISLSKVGMKGKEQNDAAENEFGIAWIGNSTNLACKQSGAVDCGTIFISCSTYSALSDIEAKDHWKKVDIQKGNSSLFGYIAKQYYLPLDNECLPCVATGSRNTKSALAVLEEKIDELTSKTAEFEKQKQELSKKEFVLSKKEYLLDEKEADLKNDKYDFYCTVLESGHCKAGYVKAMGQNFWEKYLEKAIEAGADIGMDEHTVKQKISYAMVDIYQTLELYDKAYDFLVEQALGYSWLLLGVVQNIVRKVGYCSRLKEAIYTRLSRNDLSNDNRAEFEKIQKWLVLGYECNVNNYK